MIELNQYRNRIGIFRPKNRIVKSFDNMCRNRNKKKMKFSPFNTMAFNSTKYLEYIPWFTKSKYQTPSRKFVKNLDLSNSVGRNATWSTFYPYRQAFNSEF